MAWAGRTRAAMRLFASGAALYVILGFSPVANWVMAALEVRAKAAEAQSLDGAAGIIVLGGAIESATSLGGDAPHLNESGDRMVEALRLAVRYPSLPVFFSGGKGRPVSARGQGYRSGARAAFFRGRSTSRRRGSGSKTARGTRSRTRWRRRRSFSRSRDRNGFLSPRRSTCRARRRCSRRRASTSWRGRWTSGRTASMAGGALFPGLRKV